MEVIKVMEFVNRVPLNPGSKFIFLKSQLLNERVRDGHSRLEPKMRKN